MSNEPWSFDKHLIGLQRYDGESIVEDMTFNLTPFWVQVHGILVRFMNKAVVEGICETVGQVCCSTKTPTKECGSFMRVRVLVDVSQPLCRGRVLTLDDNREL